MAEGDRDRWDARWAAAPPGSDAPRKLLLEVAPLLTGSRALDVAGGAGRDAVWLASRGFEVTLTDVSPVALAAARARAARAGVDLRILPRDLDVEPLPPGPFDVVCSFDFLCRPLFAVFPAILAPGGVLVFSQPTRTNLARNRHPSARYLLDDGELPSLVRGLEIVRYQEGWFDDRHEARLVARRAR